MRMVAVTIPPESVIPLFFLDHRYSHQRFLA